MKRYIGVTDEPLCENAYKPLEEIIYPEAEAVFCSPLIRCQETAKLIYPKKKPVICPNLRECDFGEFENKNYMELKNNPNYQAWIDSQGTMTFPSGEKPEVFKRRSVKEFQKVVEESIQAGYKTIGLVVHGGTIMSILERYTEPPTDYYSWQVENGHGYVLEFDDKKERITKLCSI